MIDSMLSGAVAGFLATAPMTVAMEAMRRLLPAREQYPLPPSTITAELTEETGLRQHMNQEEHRALTLLNHFGYGTGTGALYGLFAGKLNLPPVLSGIAYGLAVWSVSYLGLLPALGLFRPAGDQPARRNALMIVAHIIWGAVLGSLFERRAAS